MLENWLSNGLRQEIRSVFEPRYQRTLTEDEVLEIAENLTNFMESFLKFKHKKYEDKKKN